MFLIFIQNVIILLIHLLNLQEIKDLVVLLQYHGLHQKKVNIKMIIMHFYFLLINKKFILIKKIKKLFIIIKFMQVGWEMEIFRYINIVLKIRHYLLMNQIPIVVIIIMGIIILYLKVIIVIFM